MLIIILVLLLNIVIIGKLPKNVDKTKVYILFLTAIVFQFLILLVYRAELNILGRDVYYSDAEVYWNSTLDFLNGLGFTSFNEGYVLLCAIVQKTSPFIWVGWNNILNILLLDVSTIIVVSLICLIYNDKIHLKKFTTKNILILMLFTMFNPFIIYSLMRNLKDATFVFLVVFSIYIYYKLVKKKVVLVYLVEIILAIAFIYIRPWGFVIPFIIIFYDLFGKKQVLYIAAISVILIILIVLFRGYFQLMVDTLLLWVPIVMQNAKQQIGIGFFLSIARLFVGPGPVRSILGRESFLFYTESGNIMCAIGSVIWYFQIGLMAVSILPIKMKGSLQRFWNKDMFTKYIFTVLLAFILIYAMAYAGSVELRFRGVLYLLTSYYFFSDSRINIKRSSASVSMFIVVVLSVVSIVFI